MDENRYNNYEDEMEIDLIDMMFYLLKKWRGLLLAVLIGVIVGAGLYVVKNRQQQAEQAQKASELVQADEDEEFEQTAGVQQQIHHHAAGSQCRIHRRTEILYFCRK